MGMAFISNLSDDTLLACYLVVMDLNLDDDLIQKYLEEIEKRGLAEER